MCTAIAYKTNGLYFGRTLDYDFSYTEEVTVMPRQYPLRFRNGEVLRRHYAVIGMAFVKNGYPLYYDAVNEKGLCMAGLNFEGNAVYGKSVAHKKNAAQFELIPWVMSQCATVVEATALLKCTNITDEVFCDGLSASPLHWLIADSEQCITAEPFSDGVMVYDNPVGVLTNNPPFEYQLLNLSNFMQLSAFPPENRFSYGLELPVYSRGLGAVGLPGDFSSQSRFVKAAFVKENSVLGRSDTESISQFFHIADTVSQPRGCCRLANGRYEATLYTSCCNAKKGVYYFTTYANRSVSAVDMRRENLDGKRLVHYPIDFSERIEMLN